MSCSDNFVRWRSPVHALCIVLDGIAKTVLLQEPDFLKHWIRNIEAYMKEIFIKQIRINEVRHLHDIAIALDSTSKKHLIITGKNGSGKTSLLLDIKGFLASMAIDPQRPMFNENFPVEIDFNTTDTIREGLHSGEFILGMFGVNRASKSSLPDGIKKVDIKNAYDIDDKASRQFIQYIVNMKAERSFARDDNDTKTVKRIDAWFEKFKECLCEIFEDDSIELIFDRKKFNFIIKQAKRKPFDFNTLSDGYSAILNIVTELILRMEKKKIRGYDVQGIVLIDEIETHLHVELQKKILPFLTSFFPGIQFIISTHSPFILNSIANAVVYDLENKILVEDLSGFAYDGLVESYFNADKYSESIKKRIELYAALVDKQNKNESEYEQMIDLRNYFKQTPSEFAPELYSRFAEIELSRKAKGENDKRR